LNLYPLPLKRAGMAGDVFRIVQRHGVTVQPIKPGLPWGRDVA